MQVYKKLALGVVLAGVLITLTVIGYSPEKLYNVDVNTQHVHLTNLKSTILASGKLAYKQQVELRSEVVGKVMEVLVSDSDVVAKGDVVLRIDANNYQKQVEQFEAAFRQRQIAVKRENIVVQKLAKEVLRQKVLFDKQLVNEDSYESKVSELNIARYSLQEREVEVRQFKAQLEESKQSLAKTIIRSPIDGIVVAVDVKSGELVLPSASNVPGSVLVTIADPSEVLTEVHVDETDIGKIQIGQKADIFAVAFPSRPFKATIKSIATVATRSKNGFGQGFVVKMLIDNTYGLPVRPGISCRAEIFYSTSLRTLAVPISAIIYEEDYSEASKSIRGHVFLYEDGAAIKTPVTLGNANDEEQEVLTGLVEGDQVISGPYKTIRKLKGDENILVKNTKSSSTL